METSVCIQCTDLYSRQVQINVNHNLIFTQGTFKTLIITLAEISLIISKFQHGSQKLCQSGQTLLPGAGDANTSSIEVSLASQTFARKTERSGDISIYAFVTLPESGKDQSDHSTDYRVHSKRR